MHLPSARVKDISRVSISLLPVCSRSTRRELFPDYETGRNELGYCEFPIERNTLERKRQPCPSAPPVNIPWPGPSAFTVGNRSPGRPTLDAQGNPSGCTERW